ncbi:MAG: permease [Candidatus Omnitrophica bacterium]|nr:permease [Candidatus Omnitrophota bacterium]
MHTDLFIRWGVEFLHYAAELVLPLAIGFFLSGLFHEFIPGDLVEKHLGERGIKPILYSTLVGAILPICCWGSLPIAVSLEKKGARLGPVLAFLVATPATSISALLVSYRLMGFGFTVYIFISVVIMGVVTGLIGNMIQPASSGKEKDEGDICPHCHALSGEGHKHSFGSRVASSLRFGFIELPKEIGLELFIGVVIAALVSAAVPIHKLIQAYLAGSLGYIFALVVGLSTYVCSTASVPLTDAFVRNGMSVGAGMTFLLVGPITSYGTILVLRKKFGTRILLVYLASISTLSLALGYFYSILA